jgi:cytochrome c oxidase assembly factor CtaG
MTAQIPVEHARAKGEALRVVLAVLGFVLWILCLVPPVSQWSRQYEYVESIQYCLLSISIPALLASGAPWRWLGLASRDAYVFNADGVSAPPVQSRWIDWVALSRLGRLGDRQGYVLATLFCLTTIFWRVAPVVDFAVSHAWLAPIESVALVGVGLLLWLDLVESPPLKPSAARPFRIGMAAVSMWAVWVLAYLGAMSGRSWYPSFVHLAGHGVSLAADQQLSTGFMWLLSAASFLPVVFWNLMHWLQSEENPDDELSRIVRRDKFLGNIATKD